MDFQDPGAKSKDRVWRKTQTDLCWEIWHPVTHSPHGNRSRASTGSSPCSLGTSTHRSIAGKKSWKMAASYNLPVHDGFLPLMLNFHQSSTTRGFRCDCRILRSTSRLLGEYLECGSCIHQWIVIIHGVLPPCALLLRPIPTRYLTCSMHTRRSERYSFTSPRSLHWRPQDLNCGLDRGSIRKNLRDMRVWAQRKT